MTRPAGRLTGWMVALHWSRCTHCGRVIDRGDWQGLAEVPGHGPRWVDETCAAELGPLGEPRHPTHDRDVTPDIAPDTPDDRSAASASAGAAAGAGAVLRVLVIGSAVWPRERAVEVRDAIAVVVRGHRLARIAHAARVDPDTGRLVGVDAWAELTATRLHLEVEHLSDPSSPGVDAGERPADPAGEHVVDVIVAFPLPGEPGPGVVGEDRETAAGIAAAQRAGLPVLVHRVEDLDHPPLAGQAGRERGELER
ncbi:hypothetical protein [Actinomycetospora termitidis]|uniref:Uncharacterized protein n=1 Tax=Actinomycetospora termitidis TaxID=3053470 RepID=A0ABT7MKF4_9PSEU|nr:hypothetical protein [Actinomycetospora sp. Odt1-22]MDL5160412.1 hypothetical protein [Actinomycetospora sp. Odt1-22]